METSIDQPAGLGTPPPAELEYHPATALFPLLPVDSQGFGELAEDIREHGLLHPIVRLEGKILDGRNHLRACQHAGVEPRYVEWSGESPSAYVLSLNLHRRHLTEDQRAAIAVEASRASRRRHASGCANTVAPRPAGPQHLVRIRTRCSNEIWRRRPSGRHAGDAGSRT